MADIPQIPNISEYNDHFRNEAPYFKSEPRPDRGCNDKLCYALLIALTLLLIVGGIFFIASADYSHLEQQLNSG